MINGNILLYLFSIHFDDINCQYIRTNGMISIDLKYKMNYTFWIQYRKDNDNLHCKCNVVIDPEIKAIQLEFEPNINLSPFTLMLPGDDDPKKLLHSYNAIGWELSNINQKFQLTFDSLFKLYNDNEETIKGM